MNYIDNLLLLPIIKASCDEWILTMCDTPWR